MDPNMDAQVVGVADPANQLLQLNSPRCLWITDYLSMSKTNHNIWISEWVESLQAKLVEEVDLQVIVWGYRQLTEKLNSMLQQQHSTDEDKKNNWVTALLLQLLVMYVYRKIAVEKYHPDQIAELQEEKWVEDAIQVMTKVPKEAYLKQLDLLVKEAIKEKDERQYIDSTVDHALLKLHQHTHGGYV